MSWETGLTFTAILLLFVWFVFVVIDESGDE